MSSESFLTKPYYYTPCDYAAIIFENPLMSNRFTTMSECLDDVILYNSNMPRLQHIYFVCNTFY